MTNEHDFTSAGRQAGEIDVNLSYAMVDLLSESHYSSPNKAVQELVSNAFDAEAQNVHVVLSIDQGKNSSITVIDDGEGMDDDDFERHWLIGKSYKRDHSDSPQDRKQIGKFGIGKLATYVLANRLTHISKKNSQYRLVSMNYRAIHTYNDVGISPEQPIKIPLRKLEEDEAENIVRKWTENAGFKSTSMALFGNRSLNSWTISIMSDLKDKASEIKIGRLQWILSTALPPQPNFSIWLNGEQIKPARIRKNRLRKWIIGKDLVDLRRDSLPNIKKSFDKSLPVKHQHGIIVSGLGRVTGYAEVYKEALTENGSHNLHRNHGFFVYIREQIINLNDGHFGISPSALRHGTFVCFKLVVHIDDLDDKIRSHRELLGDGEKPDIARAILLAIFNIARNEIEEYHRGEKPGMKLASNLAASPASLSRKPIVALTRSIVKSGTKSRYLLVPTFKSSDEQEIFLAELEQRALEAKHFVTGIDINQDGLLHDGIVKYVTKTGRLQLNLSHPLIDTFREEFRSKSMALPLETFAMAEVLLEAHLHSIGFGQKNVDIFLSKRDQLLRDLANVSGRLSASSVAEALLQVSNQSKRLEQCVVDAFTMLGFDAEHIGGPNNPDGVAFANLPARKTTRRSYKVSLEAKSSKKGNIVPAKDVDIAGIIRNRNEHECDHLLVVGPKFRATNYKSALGKSIKADRHYTKMEGKPRTITLIEIEKLALLVKLRPVKQIKLSTIRELFQSGIPHESAAWVEKIQNMPVEKPLQYRKIVNAIGSLQKDLDHIPVTFASLIARLVDHGVHTYTKLEDLKIACQAIHAMAPNTITINGNKVGLEQSVENAIDEIKNSMEELPSEQ